MSIQLRAFAFASLALLSAACGDDPEKAQDKCETLVTSYCDRVVTCAEQADLLSSDFTSADLRDECEQFMEGNARCETAVRVSSDYGQCLSQAKALSCGEITDALQASTDISERYLTPLPSTCQGAVLYTE